MEYEYITISKISDSKSGKTGIWSVINKKHGDLLGIVSWFGSWRQYTFRPQPDTIFSAGCLDDIESFIKGLR